MIMLYMNFTAITSNCPRKNPRNSRHYYCPPATKNQDSSPAKSSRETDIPTKLQHNYKIGNKITLSSFLSLPSSSHQSSNGDLHKPKRYPREGVVAPSRSGMGLRLGLDGEGRLQRGEGGRGRLQGVRERERGGCKGEWERGG
jgi:hypothetical protein